RTQDNTGSTCTNELSWLASLYFDKYINYAGHNFLYDIRERWRKDVSRSCGRQLTVNKLG
ncbi:MAG: hypothetical protein PHQ86_01610, partial [Dehalococcoidales bacterium]|nr:hypothetical protein [Dehalococcoidales bacterium]